MALSGKSHGKNLVFKLDEQGGSTLNDLTAYTRSVDGLPGEVELADITVGGNTGHAWLRGLQNATIRVEAVFDDAVDSAYDTIKNFMSDTTTRSFELGPAGSTSGYVKISGECVIRSIELPAKSTDPLLFTYELILSGSVTVGTWT